MDMHCMITSVVGTVFQEHSAKGKFLMFIHTYLLKVRTIECNKMCHGNTLAKRKPL